MIVGTWRLFRTSWRKTYYCGAVFIISRLLWQNMEQMLLQDFTRWECILTHFMLSGFLMFSVGKERDRLHENQLKCYTQPKFMHKINMKNTRTTFTALLVIFLWLTWTKNFLSREEAKSSLKLMEQDCSKTLLNVVQRKQFNFRTSWRCFLTL